MPAPAAPPPRSRLRRRSPRAGLAAAALAATAAVGGAAAVEEAPVPFIDAHVHLNDEAMQAELMQRFGAVRAVAFWGRASDNASVAAAAQREPQRYVAFASVSPERAAYRGAWERDDPAVLAELDALLASGRFQGIGEICAVHFAAPGLPETDFSPVGPTMVGILALARTHRVPVMVHVEATRLAELEALLERFRDVQVIWAHGGYTTAAVARAMIERHPNLHYELSARTWPRHPRSPDYPIVGEDGRVLPHWLELIEARPDRFLVGTDASHRSMRSEIGKARSVQSFLRQLSPDARDRVARHNLLALLPRRP